MKYYFNCGVPQRISTMYISFNPTSSICTDSLIVMMLSALKLDVGVSAHSPSFSTSFRFFENKSLIVSWADAFRLFWHESLALKVALKELQQSRRIWQTLIILFVCKAGKWLQEASALWIGVSNGKERSSGLAYRVDLAQVRKCWETHGTGTKCARYPGLGPPRCVLYCVHMIH